MAKIKATFKSYEDIKYFVSGVNGLINDVNVYVGHLIFDGKSIVSMMNLELGREYEVELMSDNETAQEIFIRIIEHLGE